MMKKSKIFLTALSASLLATVGSLAVSASQPYVDAINVSLEAQENASSDKIRYISTMTPVMDLDSITKIDINLTLSKNGVTKEKTITTYTVYDEVTGTNGKSKIENNYYAVFTVTDLHDYAGWTLGATFEYFYIDSTSEETNTIDYTIPYGVNLDTGSGTFGESSSLEDCFTADSITNGNIFHAWNWHMSVIENNLDNIKNAGYTTIQTSPMQPQKDYYSGNTSKEDGGSYINH